MKKEQEMEDKKMAPIEADRYVIRKYPSGVRVRLAFKDNRIVEAKRLPDKLKGEHSHKHGAAGHKHG